MSVTYRRIELSPPLRAAIAEAMRRGAACQRAEMRARVAIALVCFVVSMAVVVGAALVGAW